ncbi:MAG: hypothetical protein ThorAB25_15000 [Candidatus Thorarchaeota archaeon AB_25]|nr:MAG: hypothetical protein ThorAB25_15000 [Candidatus Thorarchaeota archaeon AB_25]
MEVYGDEFTVPDNYSMEDIKHRVRSWLASPSGTDYVMEVVSERQVILTKAKHDLKICCYGCIAMIASIFLLVFIMIGISFPMYSYAALMNAMMSYVAVIGVIMAITIAVFCLKPEKAVFEMRFGNEIPIQVYIHRSGELDKSAYEYAALKDAIQGGYSQRGGPAPTY